MARSDVKVAPGSSSPSRGMKRRTMFAFALVLGAVVAATAAADAPAFSINHLLVNGKPSDQAPLQVETRFEKHDDGRDLVVDLTVVNPATNAAGNQITDVDGVIGAVNPDSGEPTVVIREVSVLGGSDVPCFGGAHPNVGQDETIARDGFVCDFAGVSRRSGILPGEEMTIRLITNPEEYDGPYDRINVTFNNNFYGACAGEADENRRDASVTAAAEDPRCIPPSRTRITEANTGQNPPTFAFTARRAKRFTCTLWRNGHIKFRHGCTSPKAYDNPLQRGHYIFTVSGVNKAGIDPTQAVKRFVVK